jgi:hypothetical protein
MSAPRQFGTIRSGVVHSCGGRTMFAGHYGPSLAIRAVRPALPLWIYPQRTDIVDTGDVARH